MSLIALRTCQGGVRGGGAGLGRCGGGSGARAGAGGRGVAALSISSWIATAEATRVNPPLEAVRTERREITSHLPWGKKVKEGGERR